MEELNGKLSDPAVIADTRGYRELMRRFRELNEINAEWRARKLEKQIRERTSAPDGKVTPKWRLARMGWRTCSRSWSRAS